MNHSLNLKTTLLLILCSTVIAVVFACKDKEEAKSPAAMLDKATELRRAGDINGAIKLVEEVATESEKVFGTHSQQYVEALHWLASFRGDLFQLELADSLYLLAETIASRLAGTDSLLAEIYLEHGYLKAVQRETDVADDLCRRSYQLFFRSLDSCNLRIQTVLEAQAQLEIQKGETAAAIPFLERFLKCRMSSPSGSDSLTFTRAQDLLLFYLVLNRNSEASQFGRELISQEDSIQFKFESSFARVYLYMSDMYRHTGDLGLAQTQIEKGISLARRCDDTLSSTFIISVGSLAHIHEKLSHSEEAEAQYVKAYELSKHAFGLTSKERHDAVADLARFYRGSAEEAKALEIERQATE